MSYQQPPPPQYGQAPPPGSGGYQQRPPPGYGGYQQQAPPPGTPAPHSAGAGGYGQGIQQQQQQQQQGYGAQAPYGADQQQLWTWFKAVDTDGSGQLSADELQRALINGDWSPFNIETVRLMVNMFDSGIQQQQQQQQQGYGAQAPYGADQQQLWTWFKAVDTDGSGQLSADELQRALINGDWSPFNIETVRLMVNMFDSDNSGTINFNEFSGLWKYIEDWKKCFQAFDVDRSGSINETEMGNALRTFGFNVSPKFINTLIQKFDRYGKGDVTFDNFVQACVTVKTLTDSFRQFDNDNDGWIQINYEQFLDLVVRQRA
ncbi:hypothetical protein RMATCC62417_16280 [Rhizopus microsporus]|nr:hypothetical protein RMATCC62417_16280 [Rhizopus microsporus]